MTKSTLHSSWQPLRKMIPQRVHRHPSLVGRHYWHERQSRHLTVLYRASGQTFESARDFRIYPHPLRALAKDWDQPSRQTTYAINLVLSGHCRMSLPTGTSQNIGPGTFIKYSDTSAADTIHRESEGFLETSVCFDENTGRLLEELGVWNRNWITVSPPLSPAIASRFHTLYRRIENQHYAHAEILRLTIELIFEIESLVRSEMAGAAINQFEIRACRLLRENHHPSFRIADAAAAMGLSETHFRRRFAQQVGMSPSEYQIRERLSRAAGLLRECSVKETASQLGYSDPFVFSRQFKKLFGVPPKEFRW